MTKRRLAGIVLAIALTLTLTLTHPLALAAVLGASPNARAIEIDRFGVSILLDPDRTFVVTESIDVDFGELQKHGIFRTIPVDYARAEDVAGAPIGTRYSIRLRVLSVKNERDVAYPFTVSRHGRDLFLRIGDPDRTVTGRVTYVITYRVERAINRFESHDELYWNVTGNEWEWPIHEAAARVELPEGANADEVRHQTFTGRMGSRTTAAAEGLEGRSYHAEVRDLGPSEGLTIVLGFPEGVLDAPSSAKELWWKLSDNIAFVLAGLLPVVSLLVLSFLYWNVGRDPGRNMPIVVQYQPPPGLSPAEVGSLLDERIDTPDIVSTVLDLAVRGYLRIEEVETTRLLFLTQKDYRFEKLERPDDDLSEHERVFLDALFSSGSSVLLSSLKYKFYVSIPSIRQSIAAEMLSKKLFPRDPERVRQFFRGIGCGVAAVPLVLGAVLLSTNAVPSILPPDPAGFFAFAFVSLLLTLAVFWIFSRVMPSKTPEGARLARYCLGFKEFIERVEKDRIERMAKEDKTLFERVLPYAVVLGVADEWAERFEGLLTEPPSWYRSSSFGTGAFYPRAMVSDLGRSMHAMGSTLTSQPSSSGSSHWSGGAGGGFSGFGGGGSSGGGFGGGGGGSW
jgi:uncharacterized membrane protein YgcG